MAKFSKTDGNMNLNVTINNYYNQRDNSLMSQSNMMNSLFNAMIINQLSEKQQLRIDNDEVKLIENSELKDVTPASIDDEFIKTDRNDDFMIEDAKIEFLDGDGGIPVSDISRTIDLEKYIVTIHFKQLEVTKRAFSRVLNYVRTELWKEGSSSDYQYKFIGEINNKKIIYLPTNNNDLSKLYLLLKLTDKFKLPYGVFEDIDIVLPEKIYYVVTYGFEECVVFRVINKKDGELRFTVLG